MLLLPLNLWSLLVELSAVVCCESCREQQLADAGPREARAMLELPNLAVYQQR
jgi:hypothetical protein